CTFFCGRASGTAGGAGRKRLHRRPGYMRGEQSRLQSTANGQQDEEEEEEEEDGRTTFIRNGKPGRHCDAAAAKVPLMNLQQADKLACSSCKIQSFLGSVAHPVPAVNCSPVGSKSLDERASPEGSFNSSFSFIRQSLTDTTAAQDQDKEPLKPLSTRHSHSKQSTTVRPAAAPSAGSRPEKEERSLSGTFWRENPWGGKEETPHLPDCDSRSVDIEVTSSLSVDSDTASASSVTSGYESATPASEQGWDNLLKKYEGVLQDCLQNNRTHTTIESMMLKLQRLQQKAILDDDYDAAERFGKKLEELCRERGALKLGLPSRQPGVALFLERLRQVVHGALQRAESSQRRSVTPRWERCDSLQGATQRKDGLIQEKRLVEEEISELQRRLAELKERSRCLEQRIQQEEQQVEAEELESSVLRSCTVAQLRLMSRTLRDLVTSENRSQISVAPPPSMLRLQEQEQALNLSIKEATAKVVMSQRLGSSLRRKVSETETQLLALHEAKLAAISGNDFGSAKELKAEMKAVYLERDRLEALAKRLHSLSSGSSQELARMKEQRQQLRQELEDREAQHGE
uniref:DISC1 scaffold protein n=1 Tax=Salarias fasciatus TaxID=181472 RepID=A0A672J7W6_SALFA